MKAIKNMCWLREWFALLCVKTARKLTRYGWVEDQLIVVEKTLNKIVLWESNYD